MNALFSSSKTEKMKNFIENFKIYKFQHVFRYFRIWVRIEENETGNCVPWEVEYNMVAYYIFPSAETLKIPGI